MDRTERQKVGIRRWIDGGGRGTLAWSTGLGKTYATILLIKELYKANPALAVLVAVPTNVLKEQWVRELAKYQLFSVCKVEVFNTIVKHSYTVDLFVIDELHNAASPVHISMFEKVKYRYFLGLTATFERLDGRHKLLEQYTSICDKITIEEAVQNKWLSDYRNYKVILDVDLTKYNEWNQKFQSLFALFDFNFDLAMKCVQSPRIAALYAKKLGRTLKEIRGIAAAWMKMLRNRKSFVMSHPKKLEIANKILDARKDKKCITFSATIKDAEQFKSRGALILHSKQKKQENKQIIETFNSLTSGVLSTSKSADAGLDVKGLSVGIILSGDSSKTRTTQRIGRAIRQEEGKIAEIFTLVISKSIEENWYSNANVNQQYITINENQLDIILNGGEVSTKIKRGIADTKYRF